MKKRNPEMRQHIIDVARSLMTAKGYTGAGLSEVLSVAGVPKGSFYYYFRSKDEFGQAVLSEYFDEYLSRIDPILRSDSPGAERLIRYFNYWIETQGADVPEEKCLVVKLGAEVCDISDDMRAVMESGTSRIIGRLKSCIAQGIEDGSIHTDQDPEAAAESLYQLWLGASLLAKVDQSKRPFEFALDTTKRLLG
ncbi:TetR/AcrR family transcriptional regulator [Salinicola halophyticus]|uniref:TetR/AcrR family transcriptional regulator n=1 Tax=Salinicola halophyticus TaxID=1808881 RepID=UPI003F47E86A